MAVHRLFLFALARRGGRRVEEKPIPVFYFAPALDAASRITLATLAGCASMMTWLDATVVVVAPIFLACAASSSGEMARSLAAMMYHDGFVFQARLVT